MFGESGVCLPDPSEKFEELLMRYVGLVMVYKFRCVIHVSCAPNLYNCSMVGLMRTSQT